MTSREALGLYQRSGIRPPPDMSAAGISKYHATRKECDGHVFDSSLEATAYLILKAWEAAGAILNLKLQPAFILQAKQPGMRAIVYIADFSFLDVTLQASRIWEIKGMKTAVFMLKVKLFRAKYPDLRLEILDRRAVLQMSRG